MYRSREISIGNIPLGGKYPIRIQSMCNTDTADTSATVEQCIRLHLAGASYVRMTVRNIPEANNLRLIKNELLNRGYNIPLIADVHFNPEIAMIAAAEIEKVRINPGNFADGNIGDRLIPLLRVCKKYGTILRIGVNHGSLSERILMKYGDSPEGMVASALEYLRICQEEKFRDVVVSMKSSSTSVMIRANRLLVARLIEEQMDPAIHLGITEAGEGEDGRIKSAIGIGTLLQEGIGDTIRVSLTEEPETEIPAGEKIIEAVLENTSGKTARQAAEKNIDDRKAETENELDETVERIPLVISSPIQKNADADLNIQDPLPDFIYSESILPGYRLIPECSYLIPYQEWRGLEHNRNVSPLFTLNEFAFAEYISENLNFILIRTDQFHPDKLMALRTFENIILVLEPDSSLIRNSYRKLYHELINAGIKPRIILKADYNIPDRDSFMIKAAVDFGGFFIDRICHGIWLSNKALDPYLVKDTSFNILQSSGRRIYKTEYIACPSCGRTLFNITEALHQVKEQTSHLKHLKIAVMGCIVNGPGEMADADYGYVGSGKGKVTIYRGKEPVIKSIREEDAVTEMIGLIRMDGRWVET